jgi:RNA polymerase sigma-70 factor (ECF subfamily)
MPADRAAAHDDGPADFDETFREHYGPMVRSLAAACGDREVAADAVQDAFTRAYARWRRISRYDDPSGWVRHVALRVRPACRWYFTAPSESFIAAAISRTDSCST